MAVCPKSQHLGNWVMSSKRWRTQPGVGCETLSQTNNKRAVVFKSLIRFSFLMFQWGGQIQDLLFCSVSMYVCLWVSVCLSLCACRSFVKFDTYLRSLAILILLQFISLRSSLQHVSFKSLFLCYLWLRLAHSAAEHRWSQGTLISRFFCFHPKAVLTPSLQWSFTVLWQRKQPSVRVDLCCATPVAGFL